MKCTSVHKKKTYGLLWRFSSLGKKQSGLSTHLCGSNRLRKLSGRSKVTHPFNSRSDMPACPPTNLSGVVPHYVLSVSAFLTALQPQLIFTKVARCICPLANADLTYMCKMFESQLVHIHRHRIPVT